MYDVKSSEDFYYVDEDSEHAFRDFDAVYYQESNKTIVSCCSLIKTSEFLFIYLFLLTLNAFLGSS